MEGLYSGRTIDDALIEIDRRVRLAHQTEINPFVADNIEKSRGMMRGLIRAYCEFYLERDLETWKIERTEVPFKIPLPNTSWQSGGKIDMVVREKKKLWIVEHKTTGELGVNYVERLPLDNQIHHYLTSAPEAIGEQPAGIIYNVILKSRLRQKKTESFEEYVDRVEDSYLTDPGRYFFRDRLILPQWSQDRFKVELQDTVEEIDRARERGHFSMSTNHCYHYGRCPYANLCSAPPNMQKQLRLNYDVSPTPHPELEPEETWPSGK
jgi:hypothetical protein